MFNNDIHDRFIAAALAVAFTIGSFAFAIIPATPQFA